MELEYTQEQAHQMHEMIKSLIAAFDQAELDRKPMKLIHWVKASQLVEKIEAAK